MSCWRCECFQIIKRITNDHKENRKHNKKNIKPLAQKLYESHFQGLTLQDKNVTIPELYKEIDEKMYILTSLNNTSNAQLIKLNICKIGT